MNHKNYTGKTINDLMKDSSFGSFAIGFYMVRVSRNMVQLSDVIKNNPQLLDVKIREIKMWCDYDYWITLEDE